MFNVDALYCQGGKSCGVNHYAPKLFTRHRKSLKTLRKSWLRGQASGGKEW